MTTNQGGKELPGKGYYLVKFYNHDKRHVMYFNGERFQKYGSANLADDEIESYERFSPVENRCEKEMMIEKYFGYKMTKEPKKMDVDDHQLVDLLYAWEQSKPNFELPDDLEEAAIKYCNKLHGGGDRTYRKCYESFLAGAAYQTPPSLKGEAATSCRWVKCSERLPEFLKEVVVKFNDIDAGLGFFTENQDWETGEKILIFRHTNSDNEDVRCDSLTIEWLEELPHPTESRGDSKDIPEELSKEDIWRKWQSDKKALIRCMEALIKLGVKTDDDLQAVLASTPTQEAATSKGWIDVKDRKQYISSIIKPQ